jgi:hypothetical protein
MSDDNSHVDGTGDSNAHPHSPENGDSSRKSGIPPAVPLAFIIIALLGGLIVMVLRNGNLVTGSSKADLSALQAEVNACRAELNRQRINMGLSPVEGGAEPISDIASRLKKDADSLVALAARFQEMIAEKDNELTARSSQLLDSEKLRKSLFEENNRLQGDMNRALINGSDADRLRADLSNLRSQRDALIAELEAAKAPMRTMSAGASADDYADLQRRYDEALRAKEFFEARVKELEGEL